MALATTGFAINFWAWALLSPLGPVFRDNCTLGALREWQVSLIVAVPVIVGSLRRIPVGALTDRYGGRKMFVIVSLASIVPVLFIGFYGQTNYAALLVGGFFLGISGTSFAVGVPFVNACSRRNVEGWRWGSSGPDNREKTTEVADRFDRPFVSNRRVTTVPVTLGNEHIAAGGEVLLNWTAANRDPLAFGNPDRYDPARNAEANLVFGTGPHACPGRPLSLMELRVILEELVGRTNWIEPAPDRPAIRATPPVGGWARVPVVLR